MEDYLNVLRKYAVFTGRATRKEYWMFVLWNAIIYVAFILLISVVPDFLKVALTLLYFVYMIALIVPGLAVSVRRLHDSGRSGWWLLLSAVPVLGSIVVLIFLVMGSQPGANQYGPAPTIAPAAPKAS